MYNSFAIAGKMNRAKQIAQGLQVQSVPMVIVDGKFMTASDKVGSHANAARGDRRAGRQGARRAPQEVSLPRRAGVHARSQRLHHRRVVRHRRGAGAALRGARARTLGLFARRAGRARRARGGAARRRRVATYAGDVRDAGALARRRRRLHRPLRRARRRHRQRRRLARHADRARRGPAGVPRGDRHQRAGHRAHVPAVRRADARGASRHAGRHRERRRFPRPAGRRRVLGVEGGGDQLPREPARRARRQRGRGGDDLPRLHRDADDREEPVPDAVPARRRHAARG